MDLPLSVSKRFYKTSTLISLLLLLCLALAGCTETISPPDITSPGSSSTSTTGSGSTNLKLFVEPDDGSAVVIDAISNAKKSVWLEVYLLTDSKVISALQEAAHRKIDVRVMLESHPYGGGSTSPAQTISRLKAAGVQAKTTNPSFALTHEKGMVVDGSTAYIMTCNLTLSALADSKSTKNREYGIIDQNDQDVQTVIDIFTADWNREQFQLNNSNLVVSPLNSRSAFTSIINSAKSTLLVEAEEMQDSSIEQALISAANRGVKVQVILPVTDEDSSGGNNPGIAKIKKGGVQVKEDHHLYMHAKIFVADGQKAFVGSENISTASLERNRELGILVSDSSVLSKLQDTFQQDWSDSKAA